MKKYFTEPKITVSMFFTENILTESGGGEPAETNYSIIEDQIGNANGGVASVSFSQSAE